jgi:hypothetical protein
MLLQTSNISHINCLRHLTRLPEEHNGLVQHLNVNFENWCGAQLFIEHTTQGNFVHS